MTAERPRVLMVDDEEDLVWTLSRQVRKERPDMDFEGFSDPIEALERIEKEPPDILVTDMRMPRMSGLELLVEARRAVPGLPVLLITAYSTAEIRREVLKTGSIEYLEKPFELSDFLETIDRALRRTAGFSGSISLPMLPDLVQIYALSRATGVLRIAGQEERGAIWFEAGEIAHCTCGAVEGEEAFYRLLTWQRGGFSMSNGERGAVRTISSSWETLLLEGCRRLDEGHLGTLPDEAEEDPFGEVPEPGERRPDEDVDTREQEWQELVRQLLASPGSSRIASVSLETLAVVPVVGPPPGAGLAEAVNAVVREARRLSAGSPSGVFEAVGAGVGLGVIWGVGAGRALVVVDRVAGKGGAAWFRFHLAALARRAFAGPGRTGEAA